MTQNLAMNTSLTSANPIHQGHFSSPTTSLEGHMALAKVVSHLVKSCMGHQCAPGLKSPNEGMGRLERLVGQHDQSHTAQLETPRRALRDVDGDGICDDGIEYTLPRSPQDTKACFRDSLWGSLSNVPPTLTQDSLDHFKVALRSTLFSVTNGNNGAGFEGDLICTGYLIAPDVMATAAHCVDPANPETFNVLFGYDLKNAPCDRMEGETIEQHFEADTNSPIKDFALVKVKNGALRDQVEYPVLPISTRIPDIGETVYLLGHPGGIPITYTETQVLDVWDSFSADGQNYPLIKLNTTSTGGNSGGPIVDTFGQAIGTAGFVARVPNEAGTQLNPENVYAYSHQGFAQASPLFQSIAEDNTQPRFEPLEQSTPAVVEFAQCDFGQFSYDNVQDLLAKRQPIPLAAGPTISAPTDDPIETPLEQPTVEKPAEAPTSEKPPETKKPEVVTPQTSAASSMPKNSYALAALSAVVGLIATA